MDPRQQQPWQTPQQPPQAPEPPQSPPTGYAAGQPQSPYQQPSYAQPPQPQQPMQPTQTPQQPPTQPTDYSVDYLNQISAPMAKTSKKSIILVWVIVALVVLTAGVFALTLLADRPSPMDRAAEMYLRMETLKKISENQHSHLRDNQLRVSNRSFTLFLTNAIRDIEEPLKAEGINKASMPKKIRDGEAALESELKAEFEDARLNITLDRVYTRQMTYQLESLQRMMQTVYDSGNNQALRDYLKTTDQNLLPVYTSFKKFAATK